MTTGMRVFLIVGSVLTCTYVLIKIRNSKMKTENSLFWISFSAVLVLLGVFPGIAEWFAGLLGVQSTVNLVFLVIIFLLLIKAFLQDQKAAQTEVKLVHLVQRYAIERKEENDQNKKSLSGEKNDN